MCLWYVYGSTSMRTVDVSGYCGAACRVLRNYRSVIIYRWCEEPSNSRCFRRTQVVIFVWRWWHFFFHFCLIEEALLPVEDSESSVWNSTSVARANLICFVRVMILENVRYCWNGTYSNVRSSYDVIIFKFGFSEWVVIQSFEIYGFSIK